MAGDIKYDGWEAEVKKLRADLAERDATIESLQSRLDTEMDVAAVAEIRANNMEQAALANRAAVDQLAERLKACEGECPLEHLRCSCCGCAVHSDGTCNCEDNPYKNVAVINRSIISKLRKELADIRGVSTSELPTIRDLEEQLAAVTKERDRLAAELTTATGLLIEGGYDPRKRGDDYAARRDAFLLDLPAIEGVERGASNDIPTLPDVVAEMKLSQESACPGCGGDGYYKGPRLGDMPCPECEGTGRKIRAVVGEAAATIPDPNPGRVQHNHSAGSWACPACEETATIPADSAAETEPAVPEQRFRIPVLDQLFANPADFWKSQEIAEEPKPAAADISLRLLESAANDPEADLLLEARDEIERLRSRPACQPMTGEMLWDFYRKSGGKTFAISWDDCNKQDAWHALAAHIWPQPAPQPDRREELRGQIKRTEQPYFTIYSLGKRTACRVPADGGWAFVGDDGSYHECQQGGDLVWTPPDAENAAEDWLIDQALKESESL